MTLKLSETPKLAVVTCHWNARRFVRGSSGSLSVTAALGERPTPASSESTFTVGLVALTRTSRTDWVAPDFWHSAERISDVAPFGTHFVASNHAQAAVVTVVVTVRGVSR